MSRYTVICHRCGKPTFVDLSKTVSDQRCRACRGFLQGVDVTVGEKQELHRKLVVKLAGAAGAEPVWHDQEMPVIPIRQRWPRYYKWIIWSGLVCLLAGIGQVAYIKFDESSGGHRPAAKQEEAHQIDVRMTPEWRKRATTFAKQALAAQTVDELLPLLYHPEVSDEVIRRYYATEEQLPLGSDLLEDYFIPPGQGKENVVAFSFVDGAKRHRAFVVVEKPKGMMIDWPSLIGLGEMSVKDYVRTAPAGVVVMRARARIGHYYNDYFSDSTKWLSIRLSDVTDENVIHGYYDRALPEAAYMEETLPDPEADRAGPDKPIIVVLKYPPGNIRSDQTQILNLISTTWYHEEGLKPLIEQARKLDAARTGPLERDKEQSPAPQVPAAQPAPAPSGPSPPRD